MVAPEASGHSVFRRLACPRATVARTCFSPITGAATSSPPCSTSSPWRGSPVAVGKHGSIAVVERFIRSMKKEGLRRLLIPLCQITFLQQLWFYIAWYNEHRPHTALRGATPNERYFGRRAANRAPRFEPRASWPRGAPCAKPQKLIKGQPGTRIELAVMFEAGRKHLPVIALRRVAWSISGFACHGSPRSRCAIGPAFRCQRIQLRFSNTSKPYVSPLKHAENRRSTTPFALTQGKRNFGEPVR